MKKRTVFFLLTLSMVLMVLIVMGNEAVEAAELKISSPAFEYDGLIPGQYTCDGMNVNPPLLIENVPTSAKSLVLIVDDPDANGIWVHWVLWNISPKTKEIKENSIPAGAIQGLNDFRKHVYGGPCPPSGTHRYFFKLYALNTILNLKPAATKADVEKAMNGHIIEEKHLIGLYKRKQR